MPATTAPILPTSQTSYQTAISDISVTLIAPVNPGGLPTQCQFVYSTQVTYPDGPANPKLVNSSTTPPISVGTPTTYFSTLDVSQEFSVMYFGTGSGLVSGTVYYWYISASNSKGTVTSPVMSFQTKGVPATPPQIESAGATLNGNGTVSTNSVTFSAKVFAGNVPTTVNFNFSAYVKYVDDEGILQSYIATAVGLPTPLTGDSAGTVSVTVPVNAALSGVRLIAGTQYFWNVTATNALGSASWPVEYFMVYGNPPGPPLLLDVGMGAVTPTSAEATLQMQNVPVPMEFVVLYGPAPAQGPLKLPVPPLVSPSVIVQPTTQPHLVTVEIPGLKPYSGYVGVLQATVAGPTPAGVSSLSAVILFNTPEA